MDEFSAGSSGLRTGQFDDRSLVILHHKEDDDANRLRHEKGAHCRAVLYETNNQLKQQYNRTLHLTADKHCAHHQEIVEFAVRLNGGLSPVPTEQVAAGRADPGSADKSQKRGAGTYSHKIFNAKSLLRRRKEI
ncbi:MAG: hypothetical protein H6636_01085 [Anaerolineales bacterium]|nr:hypothetical protein [Anaerolineales bacterium]